MSGVEGEVVSGDEGEKRGEGEGDEKWLLLADSKADHYQSMEDLRTVSFWCLFVCVCVCKVQDFQGLGIYTITGMAIKLEDGVENNFELWVSI